MTDLSNTPYRRRPSGLSRDEIERRRTLFYEQQRHHHRPADAVYPAELRRRVFYGYCQNGGRLLTERRARIAAGRRLRGGARRARDETTLSSLALSSLPLCHHSARIAYPASRPVKEGARPSLDTSSPEPSRLIFPGAGFPALTTTARPPQLPC